MAKKYIKEADPMCGLKKSLYLHTFLYDVDL